MALKNHIQQICLLTHSGLNSARCKINQHPAKFRSCGDSLVFLTSLINAYAPALTRPVSEKSPGMLTVDKKNAKGAPQKN